MHSVKRGVSACGLCVSVLVALGGVFGAAAAGTDGLSLTTNDWFDANFTALAVDTAIAQGGTTGITPGAGSWTAVPATGTAKIVEDEADASATVLAIDAAGEELVFTPVALQSATGMETATFKVKAEALDTLTAISDAQAAFTLYSADGETFSFMGYVSDGTAGVWTNLTGVTAVALVNKWFDLTMDFCGANSERLVRFAVDGTVLSDSEGTTWFPVVKQTATTINSLSFSGVGDVKTFSGDSLAEANVASYNGTGYPTVAAAIAAGEADGWASGSVTLLANAEWTPIAAGTYKIDVDGFTISNTGDYTINAGETADTVTAARIYTWNGSSDTWLAAANWTVGNDAHAAATYPGENTTDPFTVVFTKNATFSSAEAVTAEAGCNLVIEAEGYAVTMPTITYGDVENYTYVNSGTVTLQNMSRDHVVVASGATLVVASNLTPLSSESFTWFTGTGTIVFDGITVNRANNEWGTTLRSFEGTYILKNGAVVRTTGNTQSDSAMLGTGKLVFAGATLRRSNDRNTLKNSSYEIVAGTANILNGESTSSGNVSYSHECFPLDLSKTTVVSGDAMLDTETQYVIMTVDSLSKFTGATLPAVSSDLTEAGWGVFRSTNGVGTAMLVLTHNPTYTWTGAAGDGLWVTPENWKVGDYVPATAPGAGDTVSITTEEESLAIVVTDGQNVGTLTTDENVTLVGPGPYEAAVTEGVVSLTRVPSTFVWTNSGTSNWETLSNWEVNGRTTDVLPGSYDEVKFPASLGKTPYIKYSADQTISNAVIDATVTLQIVGTRHDRYIYAKEIAGDGKLVMTNSAIGATGRYTSSTKTTYSTNLVVNVDIEFAAASTNRLYCYYGNIKVNGNMTGSGCVEGYAYQQSYSPEFAGNNEDFCGEYWGTVHTGARRDYTKFHPSGTSSNAVWTVKGSEGNEALFAENGKTYYFGALNGTVDNSGENGSGYVSECWAEVGALNIDCGFGGYYARMTKKDSTYYVNHIRKVGTAKLTLSLGRGCGHVEIAGGIVDFATAASMPGEINSRTYELRFIGDGATMAVSARTTDELENSVFCDPSARIANSTYPISFSNAVNEVHTWATELAASNKGGLVKKGEGTLILEKKPLYTADTVLNGGTLKIPTAADVAVKTTEAGKKVVTSTEKTIDGVEYTVYTLGDKKPLIFMVY